MRNQLYFVDQGTKPICLVLGPFSPSGDFFPLLFRNGFQAVWDSAKIDYINVSPLFPMTMIIFFSISPASTAPL